MKCARRIAHDDSGCAQASIGFGVCIPTVWTLFVGVVLAWVFFSVKKKKAAVITIVIMIILAGVFISIGIIQNNRDIKVHTNGYDLIISVGRTGNYTIIAPIADDIDSLKDIRIISGHAAVGLVNVTDVNVHNSSGKAIMITGSGNVSLQGSQNLSSFGDLSLHADDNFHGECKYWVWCNKTRQNQTISIGLSCTNYDDKWASGKGTGSPEKEYLNEGWNEIDMIHSVDEEPMC